MAFQLMEIGVTITDEDQILALTMGLDVSYKSFVISLDGTQPELLTLDYIIHHLLNEDICHENQEVGKVKDDEKDKENVVLVAFFNLRKSLQMLVLWQNWSYQGLLQGKTNPWW